MRDWAEPVAQYTRLQDDTEKYRYRDHRQEADPFRGVAQADHVVRIAGTRPHSPRRRRWEAGNEGSRQTTSLRVNQIAAAPRSRAVANASSSGGMRLLNRPCTGLSRRTNSGSPRKARTQAARARSLAARSPGRTSGSPGKPNAQEREIARSRRSFGSSRV